MTKILFIILCALIFLATGTFALVDNSQDVLKDQETIIGDIIYTGVFDDFGNNIGIDTKTNQIIAGWGALRWK